MSASLLTEELIEQVEREIGNGNFRTLAFARFGIAKRTWVNWISIGNAVHEANGEPPPKVSREHAQLCGRLVTAIESAEGRIHGDFLHDLFTLSPAEDRDRIALMKLKAEFFKSRYGKLYSKNPNAVDDDTGKVVQVDARELLADMLEKLVASRTAAEEDQI